ncbi:MAG: hypothetical protein J6M38_09555, partial [Lentisphaeria bacterium]|nr:hypothetical protein [Lentisphaeria bacterium]
MIEVSSNSVSILYPDGTSAVFDAAELSSRIAKSCISAGMPDSWIAEDIALSVEFALQTQLLNSGEKSVHASEIDSCVVSVLEDTGYAEVCILAYLKHLSKKQVLSIKQKNASVNYLKEFFAKKCYFGFMQDFGRMITEALVLEDKTFIEYYAPA